MKELTAKIICLGVLTVMVMILLVFLGIGAGLWPDSILVYIGGSLPIFLLGQGMVFFEPKERRLRMRGAAFMFALGFAFAVTFIPAAFKAETIEFTIVGVETRGEDLVILTDYGEGEVFTNRIYLPLLKFSTTDLDNEVRNYQGKRVHAMVISSRHKARKNLRYLIRIGPVLEDNARESS